MTTPITTAQRRAVQEALGKVERSQDKGPDLYGQQKAEQELAALAPEALAGYEATLVEAEERDRAWVNTVSIERRRAEAAEAIRRGNSVPADADLLERAVAEIERLSRGQEALDDLRRTEGERADAAEARVKELEETLQKERSCLAGGVQTADRLEARVKWLEAERLDLQGTVEFHLTELARLQERVRELELSLHNARATRDAWEAGGCEAALAKDNAELREQTEWALNRGAEVVNERNAAKKRADAAEDRVKALSGDCIDCGGWSPTGCHICITRGARMRDEITSLAAQRDSLVAALQQARDWITSFERYPVVLVRAIDAALASVSASQDTPGEKGGE